MLTGSEIERLNVILLTLWISTDESERKSADNALQELQRQDGTWELCLAYLSQDLETIHQTSQGSPTYFGVAQILRNKITNDFSQQLKNKPDRSATVWINIMRAIELFARALNILPMATPTREKLVDCAANLLVQQALQNQSATTEMLTEFVNAHSPKNAAPTQTDVLCLLSIASLVGQIPQALEKHTPPMANRWKEDSPLTTTCAKFVPITDMCLSNCLVRGAELTGELRTVLFDATFSALQNWLEFLPGMSWLPHSLQNLLPHLTLQELSHSNMQSLLTAIFLKAAPVGTSTIDKTLLDHALMGVAEICEKISSAETQLSDKTLNNAPIVFGETELAPDSLVNLTGAALALSIGVKAENFSRSLAQGLRKMMFLHPRTYCAVCVVITELMEGFRSAQVDDETSKRFVDLLCAELFVHWDLATVIMLNNTSFASTGSDLEDAASEREMIFESALDVPGIILQLTSQAHSDKYFVEILSRQITLISTFSRQRNADYLEVLVRIAEVECELLIILQRQTCVWQDSWAQKLFQSVLAVQVSPSHGPDSLLAKAMSTFITTMAGVCENELTKQEWKKCFEIASMLRATDALQSLCQIEGCDLNNEEVALLIHYVESAGSNLHGQGQLLSAIIHGSRNLNEHDYTILSDLVKAGIETLEQHKSLADVLQLSSTWKDRIYRSLYLCAKLVEIANGLMQRNSAEGVGLASVLCTRFSGILFKIFAEFCAMPMSDPLSCTGEYTFQEFERFLSSGFDEEEHSATETVDLRFVHKLSRCVMYATQGMLKLMDNLLATIQAGAPNAPSTNSVIARPENVFALLTEGADLLISTLDTNPVSICGAGSLQILENFIKTSATNNVRLYMLDQMPVKSLITIMNVTFFNWTEDDRERRQRVNSFVWSIVFAEILRCGKTQFPIKFANVCDSINENAYRCMVANDQENIPAALKVLSYSLTDQNTRTYLDCINVFSTNFMTWRPNAFGEALVFLEKQVYGASATLEFFVKRVSETMSQVMSDKVSVQEQQIVVNGLLNLRGIRLRHLLTDLANIHNGQAQADVLLSYELNTSSANPSTQEIFCLDID